MTSSIAFTAPHSAVSRIGLQCLSDGCSAIDAMVAASAAISVAYPHMNSLGGDGFWLISRKGEAPVAIDACGYAARAASIDAYLDTEAGSIPSRGPRAALCQAGALDGWRVAREYALEQGDKLESLDRLLAPAINLAREGVEVSASLQAASEKLLSENAGNDSFRNLFTPEGRCLKQGEVLRNNDLAGFLTRLAEEGTESFYRGAMAGEISQALAEIGSPLSREDFEDYKALRVEPLSVQLSDSCLYNLPAPTQGVASLLILAIIDRLTPDTSSLDDAGWVHRLVEATKRAFLVRDAEVCDPQHLSSRWPDLLNDSAIAAMVEDVSPEVAMEWPYIASPGDTVWMGAVDQQGTMVSYIQSVYWEFGSAIVLPGMGLVWNNRGLSFQLDKDHHNCLRPRAKPFHTLNPAYAAFSDGRRLVYGTMGGEGQPQTQAVVFSRYAHRGCSLAEAIAAPRWLLGRTWGEEANDLKLEASLDSAVGAELRSRGHNIRSVDDYLEMMGHAGAILLEEDGAVDAASDPRSDGAAFVDRVPD